MSVEEKKIREKLHEMIDNAPREKLIKLFISMIPDEDEELTEEELRSIEEGKKQIERGETISLDKLIEDLEGDS
jgi:hypothetical protein